MKKPQFETLTFTTIVGGGQCLGELPDGRKCFAWGVLPGETATIRVTKKKSRYIEGVAIDIKQPSSERLQPTDPDSYLSTSPWQIMNFDAEQRYKSQLIAEAFELHCIKLDSVPEVFTDSQQLAYRNKVEFSWYSKARELTTSGVDNGLSSTSTDTLDLAFYRRGSKGKITVDGTSLAHPEINHLAREIRDLLRAKPVSARNLKTLLIRSDQRGNCVWQLYLKDKINDLITPEEASLLPAQGGEIIHSNPKSPASVITERLASFGDITLTDQVLGTPFRYATEGFFQVNLPVYEQALSDMRRWVEQPNQGIVDMYSGVGTIGLTISPSEVTMVEINEYAVSEMRRNITRLGRTNTKAILAPSEQALNYIDSDKIVIVDPPRAGLHADVIATLLQKQPPRIIYLSCNPVTQARDVALLTAENTYKITHIKGYNFFPRTPHIENLVVLDKN